MKSTATIALCALLVLAYCSRSRGDHHAAALGTAPLHTTTTSTTTTSTPHRGDVDAIPETTTAVVQKPSLNLSSSMAPVLKSSPTNASETDKHVANASADASSNSTSTNVTHPALAPPLTTNQTGTLAPAPTVTDGPAVTTAGVGTDAPSQTGSAAVALGNQTQPSKGTDLLPEDNRTLSTSPPTKAAPATAGPPATTQLPRAETPPSITTTTPPTPAAPIVPQSSPVPGHKKATSSSSTSSSTTTITAKASSTTPTTTSTIATSTTTTSPATAPGHVTTSTLARAAISELNVGDDDNKGGPDPLLAGLVSVFVVAAAIVSLLVFLKFRHRNERPEFRRLQDLPMDDMMEDTPLSMYSY